jgi:hypothetical protein
MAPDGWIVFTPKRGVEQGGFMAAWTVDAERVEGQLAVSVSGPAQGVGATYQTKLILVAGRVPLAQGSVVANNAAQALPLAVQWAQGTLDSWKQGLGA